MDRRTGGSLTCRTGIGTGTRQAPIPAEILKLVSEKEESSEPWGSGSDDEDVVHPRGARAPAALVSTNRRGACCEARIDRNTFGGRGMVPRSDG